MKKHTNRFSQAAAVLLAGACLLPLAACGEKALPGEATTAPQTTVAVTTAAPATTNALTTTAPETTTAATTEAPTETPAAARTTAAATKKAAATTKKATTTRRASSAVPGVAQTTVPTLEGSRLGVPVPEESKSYELKYGVRMRTELIKYYVIGVNGKRKEVGSETVVTYARRDYSASYSDLLPAAKENQKRYADEIREVLRITNQYRAEKGLPALKLDTKLCEVASVRAEECAWSGDRDHYRPNGKWFTSIFKEAGMAKDLAGDTLMGENTSNGYQTPQAVCAAWKASESHYENIINPKFTKIGIGVAVDPDPEVGCCWVQHFLE